MTEEEREIFDTIADEVIESNRELLTRVDSEVKFW